MGKTPWSAGRAERTAGQTREAEDTKQEEEIYTQRKEMDLVPAVQDGKSHSIKKEHAHSVLVYSTNNVHR